MGTSVHMFVSDRSFYDHTTPFLPVLDQSGIGRLGETGFNYFVDLYVSTDPRDPTARVVDWVATYQSSILLDKSFYSDFISGFDALDQNTRSAIFQIIDRVLFHPAATDDTETWLTTTDYVKTLYSPQSLQKSTTTVSNPVYVGTPNQAQTFSTVPYVILTLDLPQGGTTVSYELVIYCDGATWETKYPNSTIVAVSPPMSYNDLLTLALTTATANQLATATTTVTLNYNALATKIKAEAASGYLEYKVVCNDTVNNTTVSAPFLLLYKGAAPSQAECRAAVKAAVLSSGVGDATSWKNRIPDLFVDAQFYLIPLYNNATILQDSTIYPSVVNLNAAYANAEKVLSNVDTTFVQAHLELIVANYEKLLVVSLVDTISAATGTTATSLLALFPTYQPWSTTDEEFQYMSADAQTFSTMLTDVMVVATGNGTSTLYYPVEDAGLTYVSFVINSIEYCVITKDCFTEIMGGTS